MRWYVQRSKNELDSEDVGPCSVQTRHEAHFYQSAIFGVGADGPVPTLACACPGVSS